MSEKRPEYVKIGAFDYEDISSIIDDMKGPDRSMAVYAKECGIHPSVISRIKNGKVAKSLTIEMLQTLYAHRHPNCDVGFEELAHANGMATKDEVEKASQEMHGFRVQANSIVKATQDAISQGLFDRGVQIKKLGLSQESSTEDGTDHKNDLFDECYHCDLAIGVEEGGKDLEWIFQIVPLVPDSEKEPMPDACERVARQTFRIYSRIFVRDAWAADRFSSDKVSFVFACRGYYNAFLDLFEGMPINNLMTAILIDPDKKEVISEQRLGKKNDPEFSSLFSIAPSSSEPSSYQISFAEASFTTNDH